MATNKNQHFVPRCYLRQFTTDTGNKAINLYNVERDRFIEGAPVKNQCSGDYFYGQDPLLEDMIQMYEQDYASAVSEIVRTGYELKDDHSSFLRRFWLLQHLRTEAASKKSVEMNDQIASELELDGPQFKLEIRDAVQIGMRHFLHATDAVDDLGICLVRNRSNVPFVTSDDPAALSNRWHQQEPDRRVFSFGLHSAGALIFLPISPEILCVGFDRDMYSLDHRKGWVTIDRSEDTDAFNQHQHLNCRANLFVKEPLHFETIRAAFQSVSKHRPAARHRFNYAVLDKVVNGSKRYVVVDRKSAEPHEDAMFHSQVVHATPTAWPSQIRWRAGAHYYANGSGAGHLRRAAVSREIPAGAKPFKKAKAFR